MLTVQRTSEVKLHFALWYMRSWAHEGQGAECADLNESGATGSHLNAWSSAGTTILGGIRWHGLFREGVSH